VVKRSGATTIEVISIFEGFVFHSKEYSGHLLFEKHEVVFYLQNKLSLSSKFNLVGLK
jgi:hypothetical protein